MPSSALHVAANVEMFIAALSTIAKSWKELRCPSTDDWIKKMWSIKTIEYSSAIKKNDFSTFAAT